MNRYIFTVVQLDTSHLSKAEVRPIFCIPELMLGIAIFFTELYNCYLFKVTVVFLLIVQILSNKLLE